MSLYIRQHPTTMTITRCIQIQQAFKSSRHSNPAGIQIQQAFKSSRHSNPAGIQIQQALIRSPLCYG